MTEYDYYVSFNASIDSVLKMTCLFASESRHLFDHKIHHCVKNKKKVMAFIIMLFYFFSYNNSFCIMFVFNTSKYGYEGFFYKNSLMCPRLKMISGDKALIFHHCLDRQLLI